MQLSFNRYLLCSERVEGRRRQKRKRLSKKETGEMGKEAGTGLESQRNPRAGGVEGLRVPLTYSSSQREQVRLWNSPD